MELHAALQDLIPGMAALWYARKLLHTKASASNGGGRLHGAGNNTRRFPPRGGWARRSDSEILAPAVMGGGGKPMQARAARPGRPGGRSLSGPSGSTARPRAHSLPGALLGDIRRLRRHGRRDPPRLRDLQSLCQGVGGAPTVVGVGRQHPSE